MKITLKNAERITIKASDDIYHIMRLILKREQLVDRTKEHFWTIALNVAHKILNIELVGMGSRKKVTVDPVEVFSIPVQKKANSVILVHNHPAGSLKPSEADLDITNRLIQVGLIMDTPVLDHLILSEHSFYSFLDNGLIDKLAWDNKYALTFIREKQVQQEIARIKQAVEKQKAEIKKVARQEGQTEGKEEGRKTERMEIAKNLLKQGMAIEAIEKATGVTKQWLGRLKNEIEGSAYTS